MIVADTSALLSLASGNALDLFLKEFDVAVTETVVEELEELSQGNDRTAKNAERALNSKDLFPTHDIEGPKPISGGIDDGEASCAVLAENEDADFLITDDLRALPEIENLVGKEKVAISPIVLKALVERGSIDKDIALEKLERMSEERDWLHRPIYRRAKKLFEE